MDASGFHASLRALPLAVKRTFIRSAPWTAAALLAGYALPWLLNGFFPVLPSAGAALAIPQSTKAASFLLNLALLAVALARLPLQSSVGWPFLRAWMETSLFSVTAFAGLALCGAPISAAATMAALTAAQAAALLGAAAFLLLFCKRCAGITRMALALALALMAGGIFWTRPILQGFYGSEAATEQERERTMARADAGARAVLALSPMGGMAEAWNRSRSGFDLVRGHHTYVLWIGSDRLISYPRLWPGRNEPSAGGGPAALAPGLILGLGVWGIVLLLTGDLLAGSRAGGAAGAASESEAARGAEAA
ncbi:MAG: hypothetical protein L6R28_05715 [Planctomycetes bacterium]|nr:hypothetical protein [Planctomycetota bacterium]